MAVFHRWIQCYEIDQWEEGPPKTLWRITGNHVFIQSILVYTIPWFGFNKHWLMSINIVSPKSSVMLCNLAWWNAMQFMRCMHILLDKKLTLQWFKLHGIYNIVWLYNVDVYLIISILECTQRNALLPFSTWKDSGQTYIRPKNPNQTPHFFRSAAITSRGSHSQMLRERHPGGRWDGFCWSTSGHRFWKL